jgi:protein PhnA
MMVDLEKAEKNVRARSTGGCELCGSTEGLEFYQVEPITEISAERSFIICRTCKGQWLEGEELDPNHWYCLQSSIWSEVPAVQVASWRMLHRLAGESWAQDLLDQAYLEETILAWAKAGLSAGQEDEFDDEVITLDSNGTRLLEGDTVTLIKDLDVKGTSFVAKRGTTVKNIHLTGNPEHIEGKVNKMSIVLKTCFLKKIS